jgi:hypothetical protein
MNCIFCNQELKLIDSQLPPAQGWWLVSEPYGSTHCSSGELRSAY